MATRIITKNGSGAPLASDLQQGELAVDLTNKRLYTENASGTVLELGTAPSTIDINAGTIDGTVIGGSTAAAGTFTTLTASGDVNFDSNTLFVDAANNRVSVGALPTGFGKFEITQDTNKRVLASTAAAYGGNALLGINDAGSEVAFGIAGTPLTLATQAVQRMQIAGNGDISFYEDTGTTAKFFWDASAESLGIGTSSPNQKLNVSGGRSYFGANNEAYAIGVGYNGTRTASNQTYFIGATDATAPDLQFSNADGGEKVRITHSGNVGIGTSSPETNLHIEDSSSFSIIRLVASTTENAGIDFGDPDDRDIGRVRYNNSDNSMVFHTNAAEQMRIDSSGNVGINATTIAANGLQIGNLSSTDTEQLYLYSNKAIFSINTDGATNAAGTTINYSWANGGQGPLKFTNATSTVMTLDSSGNLLVGKTSSNSATVGVEARGTGKLLASATSGFSGFFNRLSTDGTIIEFAKDDTTVGSIGTHAGIYTYIGTDDTALLFAGNIDAVIPFSPSAGNYRDNAIDLGTSSYRFDDIYATNGTIQTSDRNEKQDIEVLSEAEQRVAVACKGLLRKFRWKDSVEEKGDDARIHFGIIAQDLQAAFEAEGLDAGRYAMFIHSTWTDEETGEERSRMGVRYSELLAFIIAAI